MDKYYLEDNGLAYLWSKIKSTFVKQVSGKGLSTNDYTTAEKNKLSGIASGANNYVHPTASGSKHIPSGGASGQFLKWGADGTAVWGADNNTTYGNMTAATASADGKAGLVPAPAKGKQASYLRGDGTWAVPTDTKYSEFTGASESTAGKTGLVPAPDKSYDKAFLTGSGNWQHIIGSVSIDDESFPDVSLGITFKLTDQEGNILTNAAAYIPTASSSACGLMPSSDKLKLDALPSNDVLSSTYAKKADIAGVYKYKGSVTNSSDLPATGQVKGDVYNIVNASAYGAAGANVAWDGSKWDSLGEIFTITSLTNAQIDAICV
ncbi:hypothetical protein DWX43_19300 [Clostridium sp. AF19-22AC]|uniref:hypothetical protein n=1 Tax=Clostridia TaxID=186801 RepID=UPI000E4822EC|nr:MULTISPECIES: hypothetical protein [Clostridia]RHR24790.1 hypothetical protein DWX43_19300 [Clostridium sp. AF19-22AC]DAQ34328.1 MAG TPA: hypothetical protein [Caudoviricetes sp.]